MISAKEVITSIKQGKRDPAWRVYRGRSDVGDELCAMLGFFGGIILLLSCIGFLCIGSAPGTVFFLLLGIPCIMLASKYWKQVRADERSFLVLLPKGLVLCYAGNSNNNSWLYFPSIYRIELAQESEIGGIYGEVSSRTDYWLDVYGNDGSYRKCEIDDCFGDTAYICKTIIAAFNHYRRYSQ